MALILTLIPQNFLNKNRITKYRYVNHFFLGTFLWSFYFLELLSFKPPKLTDTKRDHSVRLLASVFNNKTFFNGTNILTLLKGLSDIGNNKRRGDIC